MAILPGLFGPTQSANGTDGPSAADRNQLLAMLAMYLGGGIASAPRGQGLGAGLTLAGNFLTDYNKQQLANRKEARQAKNDELQRKIYQQQINQNDRWQKMFAPPERATLSPPIVAPPQAAFEEPGDFQVANDADALAGKYPAPYAASGAPLPPPTEGNIFGPDPRQTETNPVLAGLSPQTRALLAAGGPKVGIPYLLKRSHGEFKEKFANVPIWAKDANGNWAAFQTGNRGGLNRIAFPEGYTPVRAGLKAHDVGNELLWVDASGMVVARTPKGMAPERKIEKGVVTTLPGVPGRGPSTLTTAPGGGASAAGTAGQTGPTATDLPLTPRQKEEKRIRDTAKADAAVSKAGAMMYSLTEAKRILKENPDSAAGTFSTPLGLISNTPAGKLRSHINNLKSGVAIGTMMKLKEASSTGATGFGQLNRAELQLLLDALGSLDPNTTAAPILLSTLNRIEAQYRRVLADIKANVDPAIVKNMGFDRLMAEFGVGSATGSGGWSVKKK